MHYFILVIAILFAICECSSALIIRERKNKSKKYRLPYCNQCQKGFRLSIGGRAPFFKFNDRFYKYALVSVPVFVVGGSRIYKRLCLISATVSRTVHADYSYH